MEKAPCAGRNRKRASDEKRYAPGFFPDLQIMPYGTESDLRESASAEKYLRSQVVREQEYGPEARWKNWLKAVDR